LIKEGRFTLSPNHFVGLFIYIMQNKKYGMEVNRFLQKQIPDVLYKISFISNHFLRLPYQSELIVAIEMILNEDDNDRFDFTRVQAEIIYQNICTIFDLFTLNRTPGDIKIVSDMMGSEIYRYINRGLLSKDSVQNLLENNFEYIRKNLLSDTFKFQSIESTEIKNLILDHAKVRFQVNRDFFHGRVSRDMAKKIHEFGYYP
jgi:hypothetical protein